MAAQIVIAMVLPMPIRLAIWAPVPWMPATTLPDLSDAVDAQIGEASGLDSVESALMFWVDASNINYFNNAGINRGDAIAEWKDLSGNEFDACTSTQGSPAYNEAFNRWCLMGLMTIIFWKAIICLRK